MTSSPWPIFLMTSTLSLPFAQIMSSSLPVILRTSTPLSVFQMCQVLSDLAFEWNIGELEKPQNFGKDMFQLGDQFYCSSFIFCDLSITASWKPKQRYEQTQIKIQIIFSFMFHSLAYNNGKGKLNISTHNTKWTNENCTRQQCLRTVWVRLTELIQVCGIDQFLLSDDIIYFRRIYNIISSCLYDDIITSSCHSLRLQ